VVYEFSTRLCQIQSGRVPESISIEELEAYGELAPAPDRHIREVMIAFDASAALKRIEPMVVTEQFQQQIADLIGPEEVAWGTMTCVRPGCGPAAELPTSSPARRRHGGCSSPVVASQFLGGNRRAASVSAHGTGRTAWREIR